ncbi:MAG TPA: leucine--tRNA ligase [Candidatus Dojkabacteria bacterium]|nr:leucine--tRNA ligase [Candidatus Dojkabacteria bacterium]
MKSTYNPKEFEKKWQDKWFSNPFYESKDFDNKQKYYLLLEFPYPSGDSMHMGHTRNNSMMDSVARLRRMMGYNVMFPIGWDSFGLPTENYAIKVKRPPQEITKENIDTFRRQIKRLGISFDWSREVDTSDPSYYKWTQWIFLKLFEKGLAYKAEKPINWCPKCKTGCANEEVVDGKHERCGTDVERKNISQWVLKITEYAEQLDKDLDLTHYVESVKSRQRNWIGRKIWYDIDYKVEGINETVKVSTTRPDTQFGASFVVIAPDHEIVERLLMHISEDKKADVQEYIAETNRKSDLERVTGEKEKSGVFTGLYCLNSMTGVKLPIYLADFVLSTVGTGMVVGVPAHDKRDFEFAMKFNLPVTRVIEGPNGDRGVIDSVEKVFEDDGIVYDSGFISGLTTQEAKKKVGEYLKENKIGDVVIRFHLQDWIFSRQHYWGEPIPIIHCEKCGMVPVPEDQLPVELPVVDSYEPTDDGKSPLSKIHQWVNVKCPNCGGDAQRETDTMPNWAGSSWYFLRYTDPKNSDTFASKELQKYWMPVDHYEGGPEHVTLHLLYSRFWHKFLFDQDLVTTPEPYDIRTIHGMVLGEGGVKMSKSLGNVISPDALIDEYGADVTRGYMMFMGPYEGDVEWSTETINGVKRFVSKYYDFLLNAWKNKVEKSEDKESKAVSKLIKRVESNILSFKFNTTISALMEFYNEFSSSKFASEDIERLIITIAPVFPHIAEEVWNITGHSYSVHMQEWPKVDEKILEDEFVDIPVQINGRVRGYISVGVSDSEEDVRNKIIENSVLVGHIGKRGIKKLIYIPKRIVNVVI